MAKFEKVSRFNEIDLPLPIRKTAQSAGYDFVVAEDIIIPPYSELYEKMKANKPYVTPGLEVAAAAIKKAEAKVTLVSTGMKCKLDPGTYLELSVRSSCPLKHWLILGNSVGIIDADYYNNPDNEGEIFFQIINLAPFPIFLHRGDTIGQGIIKPYLITEDDNATGIRIGGFGSTDTSSNIYSHSENYKTTTSNQYSKTVDMVK